MPKNLDFLNQTITGPNPQDLVEQSAIRRKVKELIEEYNTRSKLPRLTCNDENFIYDLEFNIMNEDYYFSEKQAEWIDNLLDRFYED
jgi:hypothetical protein